MEHHDSDSPPVPDSQAPTIPVGSGMGGMMPQMSGMVPPVLQHVLMAPDGRDDAADGVYDAPNGGYEFRHNGDLAPDAPDDAGDDDPKRAGLCRGSPGTMSIAPPLIFLQGVLKLLTFV